MELPPEEMGFNDEEYCTLFRLPSEAYPKFKYYRERLKDFYPRLIRTIERLPNGLRSDDELQSLNKRIQSVTSSPHLEIAVFGPGNTKFALQQLLKDYTEYDEERKSLHLTDIEGWNEGEAKMKPFIGIYTMSSSDISKFKVSERPHWLEKRFQCCEHVWFIRDRPNDKKDAILAHLQEEFKMYNTGKIVVFQSEGDALSTTLSKILEEIMVMAFIHIETYMLSVTKVSNLRGNRAITSNELFADFRMSIERMLTDADLLTIYPKETNRSCFGSCLADRGAILLVSKLVQIFKMPGPTIHSFLYDTKFREAITNILLSLHDILESRCKVDQTRSKKEWTLQEYPQDKGNSMDGNSSQSQSKVTHKQMQDEMPKVDIFDAEFEKLKTQIELNIRVIKRAQPTMQILKRQHFELKGILKQTSIHHCTDSEFSEESDSTGLSVKSKDPFETWTQDLRKELTDVHFTTGNLFGNFCIFINDPKIKDLKEEVKRKIEKVLFNFPYEYEVRIIDKPLLFANGHDDANTQQNVINVFKLGMSCRSQGMTEAGTIGLFLKERNEPFGRFFITSAHVVPNRGNQVEVCSGGTDWVNLGFAIEVIPSTEKLIDITAVEVLEALRLNCEVNLKDEQTGRIIRAVVCDTTREQLTKIEGQEVYKMGATTGLTSGIVSSFLPPSFFLVSPKQMSGSSFCTRRRQRCYCVF
ncbi:hypothetical protein CHS0354_011257 [Potamilus streckersoni]|uniref:Uncharacterized protein n=1 Tax=Potamilus streckersoni TaxID=2493646 RepID=A0AAE0RNA9_9BIVA|nr:hypothetical protein CHS0354_011257 [Potamilus streckersoni]